MMRQCWILAWVFCLVPNASAGIFSNVSESLYAHAHAESWIWDATQQAFVPVVAQSDVAITGNGTADAGSGTTASISVSVEDSGSCLTVRNSVTGLHGGGSRRIADDMWFFSSQFTADTYYKIEFDLAEPVKMTMAFVASGPLYGNAVTLTNLQIGDGWEASATQDLALAAGHWSLDGTPYMPTFKSHGRLVHAFASDKKHGRSAHAKQTPNKNLSSSPCQPPCPRCSPSLPPNVP